MNLELYITILESSVEHLNKLQNLLTSKAVLLRSGMTKESSDIEEENTRMILLEILETTTKLSNGASSLLED